jgi:thymidylate kinase
MQAVYWWAVFSFGYWLKIRPRVVRGELVLFDRYLVDAIVDPRRYRFGGPPWFMRVVWRACPKPDLVVLLDVAPDELQRRKQEVTPAESRQLAAAYRGVVEGLTNGRVIPTASPDSVQAAFCKLVRDLCPAPEAT